jgi:DNA-binding transcriptional MerR regulator
VKIGELAARSGVPRETIHFYLREGLLPRPQKGGRTVAFYTEAHLERLLLVRRLREEKYLPLAVIRRLLDAPLAADDRDLDALAEVLEILPSPEPASRAPSQAAADEAARRGLLGRGRESGAEDAERRVLALVDDALALDPRSRALTLDDLAVCARDLTEMVGREAALFFEDVIAGGDVGASIVALRVGRGVVARYIAAYRDLAMRRLVDDAVDAIRKGSETVARTAWVPLSRAREADLGLPARVAELRAAAARGDAGAPDALVDLLFACGAVDELAATDARAELHPREAALVAWASHLVDRSASAQRAFERASLASRSPLVDVLAAESRLARAVRVRGRGESFLDEGVAALRALVASDPAAEPDAWARSLASFHRGRLELALPALLGRRARGEAAVAESLRLADALDAAARARLELNAELALARACLERGDAEAAARHEAAAVAIDPSGPVASPRAAT